MAFILVVDDDELVSDVAAEALMAGGHVCGRVPDVDSARALLHCRRPDLLVLDQDMPGTTGASFLRELRSSPDTWDLPVMMLTRVDGVADETIARNAGAQDYMRKPFDRDWLLWRVDQLLETHPRTAVN